MKHQSIGDRIFDLCNTIIMLLIIVITLYPIWHIAVASISQPEVLMQHRGLIFLPLGKISLGAYGAVFENPMLIKSYANTIFVVAAGTFLNILLTSLGAYGLSRKGVKLKTPLMFLITFTMLFSGGLIPTYLLVNNLGLVNSRWALLLPHAMSVYNLIIMRTSFEAIPDSLEESARLDGANDITILFRIILPLSKAVVAVMVLFYAVFHWNAWFDAMVYLRKRELYPLQLILREILILNSTESMSTGAAASDKEPIGVAIQYATIIVSTLPIMLVYPFLQKYFMAGVMVGAVKQ